MQLFLLDPIGGNTSPSLIIGEGDSWGIPLTHTPP